MSGDHGGATADEKKRGEVGVSKLQVARTPVMLEEQDLEERFIKGSGPGGQKINKVRNCVELAHKPTGLRIQCQRFRDLTSNRKEARKLLSLKLDDLINGQSSKHNQQIAKAKKAKAKSKARSAKKHSDEKDDEEDE
ncbi:hypothetical protein SeLEV6574_g05565 [Synchytrium endobioticum]|uniref:Prokaryotic-type class I peptide chain release factors domain-containing protein n=1 Tax=Synchytrium endobioticum TaxID=286115 RepID=A0A507CTT3_9FUNG|nr:hypothetical protein SeLEV6574_g05565 [Synchytrium endobioticum]